MKRQCSTCEWFDPDYRAHEFLPLDGICRYCPPAVGWKLISDADEQWCRCYEKEEEE